jgi:hypothetical protein
VTYILIALGATYALWVFYIAVMGLKRVRDTIGLSPWALRFGYPILIVGYVLDVFVNWFVFTIVMLEIPKELTVSSRLKRHNQESTGWRLKIVKFIEPLLDPFDLSGDHI